MTATMTNSGIQLLLNDNLTNELKTSIRAGADYLYSVTKRTLESLAGTMILRADAEPIFTPDGAIVNGRQGVRLQLELLQSIQNVAVNAKLTEQKILDPTARDIELLRLSRAMLRHWSDVHLQRFDEAMTELMANEVEAKSNA